MPDRYCLQVVRPVLGLNVGDVVVVEPEAEQPLVRLQCHPSLADWEAVLVAFAAGQLAPYRPGTASTIRAVLERLAPPTDKTIVGYITRSI
jgi:hypothetical protein